jgi:Substrate binding domain of ABC-type glycine betaine transport system
MRTNLVRQLNLELVVANLLSTSINGNAVILYRADLEQRAPEAVALFKRLGNRIDAQAMREMNARVILVKTAWQRFWQHTREHLVSGGYGQPILTGIRLDDTGLILQGAIPAAVLALLVQGVFELVERRLSP